MELSSLKAEELTDNAGIGVFDCEFDNYLEVNPDAASKILRPVAVMRRTGRYAGERYQSCYDRQRHRENHLAVSMTNISSATISPV